MAILEIWSQFNSGWESFAYLYSPFLWCPVRQPALPQLTKAGFFKTSIILELQSTHNYEHWRPSFPPFPFRLLSSPRLNLSGMAPVVTFRFFSTARHGFSLVCDSNTQNTTILHHGKDETIHSLSLEGDWNTKPKFITIPVFLQVTCVFASGHRKQL